MTRAVVLGGGGTVGIAWLTGLIYGMAAGGAVITDADMFLGTSAGATVAAQITSGTTLSDLFSRQINTQHQNLELVPLTPLEDILTRVGELAVKHPEPAQLRRAIGRMALMAYTVSEADRRAVIARRLPNHHWPVVPLYLVAVRADTGETAIFGQGSGVGLVDAVAASCAVPGIWPPVTLGAYRYMDGGVRSGSNADLIGTPDKVLVLAPMGTEQDTTLPLQLSALNVTSAVHLVEPDTQSHYAMGSNALDNSLSAPSARAGYTQGQAVADTVRQFWNEA